MAHVQPVGHVRRRQADHVRRARIVGLRVVEAFLLPGALPALLDPLRLVERLHARIVRPRTRRVRSAESGCGQAATMDSVSLLFGYPANAVKAGNATTPCRRRARRTQLPPPLRKLDDLRARRRHLRHRARVRGVAGLRLGDRARARARRAADRRCGDRARRRRLGRPAPAPPRPDRGRGRPGHRAGDHRNARPDRLGDDRDARRPAGDLRARRRLLPARLDRTDPRDDQPRPAPAGERAARARAERDANRRPGDRRRDRRGRQPGVGASDRCRVLWARRAAPGAAEAAEARRGRRDEVLLLRPAPGLGRVPPPDLDLDDDRLLRNRQLRVRVLLGARPDRREARPRRRAGVGGPDRSLQRRRARRRPARAADPARRSRSPPRAWRPGSSCSSRSAWVSACRSGR